MRTRLMLRTIEPDGNWLDRLLCSIFWHIPPSSPDEATFVYEPDGTPEGNLVGMICERCGGLIR